MAVIRRKEIFIRNLTSSEGGIMTYTFREGKRGLELEPGPRDGVKQVLFAQTDDYLASSSPQHGLHRVEARDAQVPEFSASSIMDLSSSMSPTLDTPSIIDSIVDVLPFRFNQISPVQEAPNDILSAAAASAMLGIGGAGETFQDLSDVIIADPPMPVASPLQSPTGESVFSDVTAASPSLHSAASTSSTDSHFFSPDFELLASPTSFKGESLVMRTRDAGHGEYRYAEMRRRNNIASKRSRTSKREKEREMEQQYSLLQLDNQSLKTKVKDLEELVEKTKKIIIEVVTKRSAR